MSDLSKVQCDGMLPILTLPDRLVDKNSLRKHSNLISDTSPRVGGRSLRHSRTQFANYSRTERNKERGHIGNNDGDSDALESENNTARPENVDEALLAEPRTMRSLDDLDKSQSTTEAVYRFELKAESKKCCAIM